MTDQRRTEIFARLRHAAKDTPAEQIQAELRNLGAGPAAPLIDADVALAFLTKVLRNQGSIAVAHDRSSTVKAIGQYLYQRYRSQKLVAGNDPRLAALPWRDAGLLPRFGAAQDGDAASLSYAQLAIAETGATVLLSGRHNPTSNNLLVEDHIVLVDAADLVADMDAAWQQLSSELAAAEHPRGIHFIAGPSSTADIALQLVMGAHGPRHWHVVLIGAELPADLEERARALA